MAGRITRIDIDTVAIHRLDRQPQVVAGIARVGQKIATQARATGPSRTQHYRKGISARIAKTSGHTLVVARDFKSWWVEAGTPHNRAHHTLELAGRMFGRWVGVNH